MDQNDLDHIDVDQNDLDQIHLDEIDLKQNDLDQNDLDRILDIVERSLSLFSWSKMIITEAFFFVYAFDRKLKGASFVALLTRKAWFGLRCLGVQAHFYRSFSEKKPTVMEAWLSPLCKLFVLSASEAIIPDG